MSAVAPYDGRVYIADKSAWVVARHADVAAAWRAAVIGGQIVTCEIVKLELLYSARDAAEFVALDEELSALRNVAVTQSVCSAAVRAMGELSARSDGYHRVPTPDILIAAAAQDAGVGVLHYDAHYDRLAEVFNIESRWVAAAGTV